MIKVRNKFNIFDKVRTISDHKSIRRLITAVRIEQKFLNADFDIYYELDNEYYMAERHILPVTKQEAQDEG